MTHIELHEANGTKVLFPVHGSVFREMPEGAVQCMSSAGFSINPVETFIQVQHMIQAPVLRPSEPEPELETKTRIKKPKAQQKTDEKTNDKQNSI